MIRVELSQFCCFLHSVVKTTQLIHKFDLNCISSQPYATLGNRVDLFGLHATAFRYDVEECLVAAVHIGLHELHGLFGILA